jgi:hypothetical protein
MTSPNPVFEFPFNDADENEGLGDAGIETFRDAPYASCAREAGQNSRDAGNRELAKPVRLTFNVLEIKPDDFPDYERLHSALSSCLEQAKDEKEKDFFANALKVSSGEVISVLRIADYNTSGLTGPPDQPGTPFHSLLKSKGITNKGSPTSGGSFGIGKSASIAVSDMQTVFYSTRYIDKNNGKKLFASQGKVVLVSHEGADGRSRRATGYWGNPDKFRAVTDDSCVPEWLRRDEVGTSIFCMGFRNSEHWAQRMICSLISNFFATIHREEMEFEVESYSINHNTLRRFLESSELSQAVETTAHKADLEFAKDLYDCLTSQIAHEEEILIDGLGKMRIRILVEKGMPSRVGFIRNGMLITDNLGYFGQPLKRFSGTADFICIVEPADEEAGKLLKQLENPAHNSFSAERLSDPAKRAGAKKAMDALVRKLRSVVTAQAGVQSESASVIDELAYFFNDGRSTSNAGDGEESDPERYTYKISRITPRPNVTIKQQGGHRNGGSAGIKNNSGKRATNGGNRGTQSAGRGDQNVSQTVILTATRNRVADSSGSIRSFFFSAEFSGMLELSIKATGVNAPANLTVKGTTAGTLKKGRVFVPVVHGERQRIDFEFVEPYDGPIEVSAATIADVEAYT